MWAIYSRPAGGLLGGGGPQGKRAGSVRTSGGRRRVGYLTTYSAGRWDGNYGMPRAGARMWKGTCRQG